MKAKRKNERGRKTREREREWLVYLVNFETKRG